MFSVSDRRSAQIFISSWYGFDRRKIHIAGMQLDEEGRCLGIHFMVYGYTRQKYLARRRTAAAEWELILLP
jgi:hypothetical protein